MGDFNNYLGVLKRKSLNGSQSDIGELNKESGEFIVLVGTTAPKLITDSVTMIQESAQTLKDDGNQAGKIRNVSVGQPEVKHVSNGQARYQDQPKH